MTALEPEFDVQDVAFLAESPPPRYVMTYGKKNLLPNPFWIHVKEVLERNPGRWALVIRSASRGVVPRIKSGSIPGIDPEMYDITTRTTEADDKKVSIYMRYIGADEGSKSD